MSVLDTLVTDRSQSDVNLLLQLQQISWGSMTIEEQLQWLEGLASKGSYNVSDLNRVGEAMQYIADTFNDLGYTVDISSKTDWQSTDIVTETLTNDYLNNLRVLRSTFATLQGTPAVPSSLNKMTFETANSIERILTNIGIVLDQITFGFDRSNAFMFYSGQSPLPSFYTEKILVDKLGLLLVSSDNMYLGVW